MIAYTNLSKLYGLLDIISNDDNLTESSDNTMITVIYNEKGEEEVQETTIEKEKSCYQKNCCRFTINGTYKMFILLILLGGCIIPIVQSIITKNIKPLFNSIFTYMFFIQYVSGVILHGSDYYKMIQKKIHSHGYDKIIGMTYFCFFGVASLLSFIPIFDSNINLSNNTMVFYNVFIIVNRFVSYNIFFANSTLFVLMMYLHCCQIEKYKESLTKMINDNIAEVNINSIIEEYTEIKNDYSTTVGSMNNLCASIIVFTIIGTYFTIINIVGNTVYSYIDTACGLAILVGYIISITIITNVVNDIKSLIDSPKFLSMFLQKNTFATMRGDIYKDYDLNETTPLVSPLKKKNMANTKSINNQIIIENIEQVPTHEDINKKTDAIKTIVLKNMIISTETGISIDWIVLYTKLSDPWERFMVCGFEINDSQIFQQMVALAGMALGVLEISKIIN